MTYVFYDTETTGTNTAFDQILQFGAIRTDEAFRELERFEMRCRILQHVVPSPGAMRVTGVTAEQLDDPTLPSHYQMVRQIRNKVLEWSPAVFIGHNSLGFDEPLLRQAFYKTLSEPYLTNSHGNGRTDTLRLLQAAVLLKPNAFIIPHGDNGRPSFKLDRLSPANGFSHDNAHDAMADVEATIHMCRLLAEQTPDLWWRGLQLSRKSKVSEFLAVHELFAMTDFYFGRSYSWYVAPIGPNPVNSSELFVLDLTNDPQELLRLTDTELKSAIRRRPKPVRSLKMNAAPVLWPIKEAPTLLRETSPDLAELRSRAKQLRDDEGIRKRLLDLILDAREPFQTSEHLEEQIYDGFASRADSLAMERFHQADWADRLAVLQDLADPRYKGLGQRLIYSEAPEVLPDDMRFRFDEAVARRLVNNEGSVPWLTLSKAIEEGQDLLATAVGSDAELLKGHMARFNRQVDWAGRFLN
ncbi:exonuclease domain-containing protein [uncultured Roseibium sp.]|uniref:exonuclease domain-containing protein n=1 Tax=uncultured Roseibium sp. TaxID=1936171 RepID=UPI00261B837D|nr:exonuclease domain-containing protein [uncultured Roseibium sp.]